MQIGWAGIKANIGLVARKLRARAGGERIRQVRLEERGTNGLPPGGITNFFRYEPRLSFGTDGSGIPSNGKLAGA